MKKITLSIYLLMAVLFLSCEKDGGTSNIVTQEGAVPDITANSTYPTILNLTQIAAGEEITIGFTVDIGLGNVASADVVGFYQKATGEMYGPAVLASGITSFPHEVTVTTSDLIGSFDELNELSDFELGDNLVVTTELTLEDGRVVELYAEDGRMYGADIHTASIFTAAVNYPVGCPLDGAFTGKYQVTVSGDPSGFGPFADSTIEVELAETSQTLRTFDFTYLPGAGGFGVSATLEFVCGQVTMPAVSTGVGCGGGEITFGTTGDSVAVDSADDSEFTLEITDFITDGGCAEASRAVTLHFQKI